MDNKKIGTIVTDLLNIRYLTNFSGTTAKVFITNSGKYFITDFRYTEQAKGELMGTGFTLMETVSNNGMDIINDIIEDEGITHIEVEDKNLTLADFASIKKCIELGNDGTEASGRVIKGKNLEYSTIGDRYDVERMIKTDKEITIIREAVDIAEKAFLKIKPMIKAGITEKELSINLEMEMKRLGASAPSFDIIVASNYRSAMPHGVATDKVVDSEGFIKFDFGCMYKGYASDITRTFYLGSNPTDKHKKIYETVLAAQKLAVKSAKAGMTNIELDKIARDYIEAAGYGKYFAHGLGHSFGLDVHELPSMNPRAEEVVLKEGMVITIEPGIYIEGFGGVRIEDDILITKDGSEVLTTLSKEFELL